jgi:hypothetical protein
VNETKRRFVICLRNDGVEDLELHKLYEVLPDEKATRVGYLRVIDESGEDYLYPADRFGAVDLSKEVEEALVARSTGAR